MTHIIHNIEGCEDFQEVVNPGNTGGGYDWNVFEVFYSPSARRFFWYDGEGCSCNAPYDNVHSRSDLNDGDYGAALKATKEALSSNAYNEEDLNTGIEAIRKKNFEVSR